MTAGAWAPGRRLLTTGLVAMVTAVAFEGLAVPTALPATLAELGQLNLYGWTFSAFWLTNLFGITLAGMEADRRGPMLPFLAGTACFALGLVVAGLAPTMTWVVVGRAVQGLGAGAIAAITYVAVARGYDRAAQPRMIAIVSSAWVVPGLVGPALAGFLAEAASWRWIFLGLAPLVPLAAVAVARPMRRFAAPAVAPENAAGVGSSRPARDAAQLVLGAGAVLTGVSGVPLLAAIPLLVVGALLARGPLERLLPAGTLRARPGRAAAVAALAVLSIAFFGTEAFVPLAVSAVRNAGTVVGGLALTTAAVTWAIGSWLQARLAASRPRRTVTAWGFGLVLVGIGLQAAVPLTQAAPVWLAAAAWAIAGLGMGLAYSTLTLVTIETAPEGEEGAASAAVQLGSTLGIAIGTGLTGAVVSLAASTVLGLAPGIAIATLLMAAVCAVGLSVVGGIPDPVPTPREPRPEVAAKQGPSL